MTQQQDPIFQRFAYSGPDIRYSSTRIQSTLTVQQDNSLLFRRVWPLRDLHTTKLPPEVCVELESVARAQRRDTVVFTRVFRQWSAFPTYCRLMGFTEINKPLEWGDYTDDLEPGDMPRSLLPEFYGTPGEEDIMGPVPQ